jgi:hypothetical protein
LGFYLCFITLVTARLCASIMERRTNALLLAVAERGSLKSVAERGSLESVAERGA